MESLSKNIIAIARSKFTSPLPRWVLIAFKIRPSLSLPPPPKSPIWDVDHTLHSLDELSLDGGDSTGLQLSVQCYLVSSRVSIVIYAIVDVLSHVLGEKGGINQPNSYIFDTKSLQQTE